MIEPNSKHPNYDDQLLPVNNDIFKPEFRRDTKGSYFMQLPGYGKWMVSVEPGSKIISQGSQDEGGGPATDFGSIRTGTLNVDTILSIGDSIYMDGGTGCIIIGDTSKIYLGLCKDGIKGVSDSVPVFAFLLQKQTWEWRAGEYADKGDVLIGDISNGEYVYWNDDESKLYIKGDLIIHGDLQSENFVTGVSGWRLGYYDDTAEFQDVWVRGKITMEAGSSGDADYIDESAGRKWAAESGADITNNHTSNNTDNVAFSTANNTATGAARGLNAINASYRYQTWLQSSDMVASGVTTGPAVVMDSNGIYGWNIAGDNTFQLNALTGDALFRGTVYASAGLIGGWAIDADRIWNQLNSGGHYTKIELNIREGPGVAPHFQVFSDTDSLYGSPTGIQMTSGKPADADWPNSRLDIYDNGNKRVMLNREGLFFFNSVGTLTSQIKPGNIDGDVTFGGGVVRLFGNGVRVAYQQPFSAADNAGRYFQMYCDSTVYGVAGILSAPTSNYIKIASDGGGSIAYFNGNPGGQWALSLFGNLALYTNTWDQGSTTGALYFNSSTNELRLRDNSGWTTVGGAGLPSGNSYDMLRCTTGTAWETTSVVYYGALSTYRTYRDWGGDIYHEVPSGKDYAWKRGSTFYAVLDNNFWTRGNLYADGQVSVGGTIQNSGGDFICNSGNLQLKKTGAIVAIKTSGGSTKYLTCQFDATVGAYILKN